MFYHVSFFFLTGCFSKTYHVILNVNGGFFESSDTIHLDVNKDDTISFPSDPSKEGYVFGGWYLEKECTTKYDLNSKVDKNIELFALFQRDISEITFMGEKLYTNQKNIYILKEDEINFIEAIDVLEDVSFTVSYNGNTMD